MKLFRYGRGAFEITVMPSDPPEMEFDTRWDSDDRLYLSKEIYNCGSREEGGFRYRFAIKAFDIATHVGNDGSESPLHVELYVVSPQAAGAKGIKEALTSCGYEDFPERGAPNRHAAVCEALLSYGTAAGIYSLTGGHARVFNDGWWEEPEGVDLEEELDQGVKLMRQHAYFVYGMFGFYMDAPLNAIGATGWDWVKGDITRPLREEK